MADFVLTVATPERQLVEEPASDAQIPALNGYMGVLPGHAPLLSELANGTLSWTHGGQPRYLAVMGGFVEVLGDRVRVLADSARRKEDIDSGKAQEQLTTAQQALAKPPFDQPTLEQWDGLVDDVKKAQAELDTAAK